MIFKKYEKILSKIKPAVELHPMEAFKS